MMATYENYVLVRIDNNDIIDGLASISGTMKKLFIIIFIQLS